MTTLKESIAWEWGVLVSTVSLLLQILVMFFAITFAFTGAVVVFESITGITPQTPLIVIQRGDRHD